MRQWKTTWGCAHRATCFTRWDQDSFSYTIRNNLYGTAVRLRYSNWYGVNSCDIKSVSLLINDVECQITTGGRNAFRIEGGAEGDIYSDAKEINITPGFITVTVAFPNHNRPESGQTFMTPPGIVMILQSIEILCENEPKIVAVLGDSIAHWGKWIEPLTRKLYSEMSGEIALFEMAINGSRLLNGSPRELRSTLGYDAMTRLKHDILPTAGLTKCVFALGLNDLCTAEERGNIPLTLDSYKKQVSVICNLLKDRKIQVVGLTILPRKIDETYTEERNDLRIKINEWIVNEAPFDAVADVASAVKNDQDTALKAEYAWEDECHISEKGGEVLASVIKAYV